MSNFAGRISICHNCSKRQQTCSGACPCTIDGRDISEHAENDQCPENRFTDAPIIEAGKPAEAHAVPLAGDILAAMTKLVGADKAAARLARMLGKANCGCSSRRAWMNQKDEVVREKIKKLDRRLRKALGLGGG